MDLDNLTQISKRDLEMIQLHQFQQPIYCCNVTAIAYAFTALGYLTTVDEIFYVAQLPIASVLDDGMTLAETYDTCLLYIKRKQLPLSIRVEHFDKPSMTLEAFIREVEAAVCDETDVHILNFNTRIAHENPSLEGGHFSLLADYNPDTQEITIADTNPKRYTRFWKCPIQRLYAGCVDKDSSSNRSRGMIVLRRLETNLAGEGVVHPADIALNELHSNNEWVWKRVGKASAWAPSWITSFLAETKSSGIFKKAKESAIGGGTFFCWGKVTPHAEFNIWFNAEAEERQYLIAEMILLKMAKVRVEIKSELTRGQRSIDSRPVPKIGATARVALQVDRGKYFTSFVEDLK